MTAFTGRHEEGIHERRSNSAAWLRNDQGGKLDVVAIGTEGQQPDRGPIAFCDDGVGVEDVDQRPSARLIAAAEVSPQTLGRPRFVVQAVGADREVAAHLDCAIHASRPGGAPTPAGGGLAGRLSSAA